MTTWWSAALSAGPWRGMAREAPGGMARAPVTGRVAGCGGGRGGACWRPSPTGSPLGRAPTGRPRSRRPGRRQGRQSALDTRSRSTWRRSTRWVLVVRAMSAPRSWTRPLRVRACRRLLATAWSSPGAPRRGGGLLSSEPGLDAGTLDLSTTLRRRWAARQSSKCVLSPQCDRLFHHAQQRRFVCAARQFAGNDAPTQLGIPSDSVGNES
jgi:hypothetical protein